MHLFLGMFLIAFTTLAVEISYRLPRHQVLCDLLFLLPASSIERLEHCLSYLTESP